MRIENKFCDFIDEQLEKLAASDGLRDLREASAGGMLKLSSNDYLGLADDAGLYEEFYANLRKDGFANEYKLSASSSRLLTGNHGEYQKLEDLLGVMYGGREAIVFNSGYHGNLGVIPAIAGKEDLVLCDKFNHASIIDGCLLAKAKMKRYRHLDYEQLEKMLENRNDYRHVFIVSESVFSMDGDIADLGKLVEIKEKYDCVLIVDEAHAIGVMGEKGCGVCEEFNVIEKIDIIIATFGKAVCSVGACAITNKSIKRYLVNKMRTLIYTTALPPINVSWTKFVLEKIMGMNNKRKYLRKISKQLRGGLNAKGFETMGESQIVPLIVGGNSVALELANKMRGAGLDVFAIRPPTVEVSKARVRFSLNANLDEDDIVKILNATTRIK